MIRAAEQRLAFAKKCEQMARSQSEVVQAQLEAARRQLEAAQVEVKAASSFLVETRDKLQVIDVDNDDDDDTNREGRKLKRKASLSPDSGREKKSRNEANVAAPVSRPLPSVASASDTPSSGRENVVEQILVEGAGVDRANGTYQLSRSCCNYDPAGLDKTVPSWNKWDSRNDKNVKFIIYRSKGTTSWVIASATTAGVKIVYVSKQLEESAGIPHKTKWIAPLKGNDPSPRLKW